MKSIIITFMVSFILLASLSGQWQIVNDGSGVFLNVNAMDFINDDIGWSAGENVIYQTKDGGNTWISLPISQGLNFNGIDFINDLVGWAVQGNGIYKTLDGGISWNQQTTSYYTLNKLCAITEKVVYAAGDSSNLKTSDGGSSWENISPEKEGLTYNSISFINADTGIIAGGNYIFRTFNGGITWDKKTKYEIVSNAKLIDDKVGYYSASNGADKYFVCKTTDIFNTRSVIFESIFPVRNCHFFKNGAILLLIEDSTDINFLKSKNGGLTWEKTGTTSFTPLSPHLGGCNINFVTENIGYIIYYWGRMGGCVLIMKSVDQGNSWTIFYFNKPFYDVCFINRDKGFFVGGNSEFHRPSGSVLKTYDGAKSWNFMNLSWNCPINCCFANNSNGFILYGYGYRRIRSSKLYQTLDGGDNWFENSRSIGEELLTITNIIFVNEQIGYFSGGEEIDKTLNGGESWEVMWKDTTTLLDFNSIYFINESTGWAIGECGLIMKYTDLGTWEKIASGTDLPLNKVFFSDNNTGWIAGGFSHGNDDFHPVLLKTETGGQSWFKIENVNYLIHDLFFRNTQEGWAVGEDINGNGVIIVTNNGGTNWYVAAGNLSGPLRAIHFKDGVGWAVGDNGLILKTYDSTITAIDERAIVNKTNDIILQNYPNPFHSSTEINYRLSVTGSVELSVCNVMGRKVATLVNEKQPAGSYEVEWNAEGIKPGVYFCELKAGQSRKVVKMVLIK
jgi:photosystem II stability/assembly factor-like uncharacterized protein